jgi:hypothetical protein
MPPHALAHPCLRCPSTEAEPRSAGQRPRTYPVTSEIPNVQLFVQIIGGRYGSKMPDSEESVIAAEYQKAVKEWVPIFALVEQGTYNDFQLYRHNMEKSEVLESITFPTRIA